MEILNEIFAQQSNSHPVSVEIVTVIDYLISLYNTPLTPGHHAFISQPLQPL